MCLPLQYDKLLCIFTSQAGRLLHHHHHVMNQALIYLFQPHLIHSPMVFQVIFIHLVYNSAKPLASCCCSFLSHVVANLICIFVVSCQLVLLLPPQIPSFLIPFEVTKIIYQYQVSISVQTQYFTIIKTNQLLLCGKQITVLF